MKHGRLAAAVAVLIVETSARAWSFPDDPGPRALAMGGAGRGDARGDQGPRLNPSGMSLARLYTVEGGYEFITHDIGHLARVSVVDSTSGSNLAGGLYYSYRTASPVSLPRLSGHEAGLSFSYPFAERVLVGVSGKYLNVSGGFPEADGAANHGGITADAGVTVRVASILTIGVVGYNLRDLSTVQAPLALGYGLALYPIPDLVVTVDGVHDFTTSDHTRGVQTTVGGGGEYVLQHKTVLRAGGGRDGVTGHGYVCAGVAALSELGAVDVGFRQDVTGDRKLTFIAVGVRLFVPQP
jgi:hypothetical protein